MENNLVINGIDYNLELEKARADIQLKIQFNYLKRLVFNSLLTSFVDFMELKIRKLNNEN